MEHPSTVYVRESAILPKIDEWIATLFNPANLDETCRALAESGGRVEVDQARLAAAERALADCNRRLAGYRKALDDGADPVVVSGWINEVTGERLKAQQEIEAARPVDAVSVEGVRVLVAGLGDITRVLSEAHPELKQRLYQELDLGVSYDPNGRRACATVRVGGGT